jgi:hypothetical protein
LFFKKDGQNPHQKLRSGPDMCTVKIYADTFTTYASDHEAWFHNVHGTMIEDQAQCFAPF